jgi:Fe-S oxidoreductase
MSLVPGSGIGFAVLEVLFGLVLTGVFLYSTWDRIQLLLQGKKEVRWDRIPERIVQFVKFVLGQSKLLQEAYGGSMHFLIFWGFMILGLTIANFLFEGLGIKFADLPVLSVLAPFQNGNSLPFTEGFFPYHVVMDTFILLVLITMGMAYFRRLVLRPERMELTGQALIILTLITLMMLSDLMLSGAKIVEGASLPGGYLSFLTAKVWEAAGLTEASAKSAYTVSWWLHWFVFWGFLNYLPLSKHQHIMAAPFNSFLHSLEPKGALQPIPNLAEQMENFDEKTKFGANSIPDFTWKQLLDGVTCQECGRCQDLCPAYTTGKALSPKKLHLDLKHVMLEEGHKPAGAERKNLISDEHFSQEFIWACTTCRGCEWACPVLNEHIQKIVDLRRYLTLMEGNLPAEGQVALQNIEKNSNPWGVGFDQRAKWTEGLDVPVFGELSDQDRMQIEYCYYVGCSGSFDERNKKIAQNMVKIMKDAGVKFAILGAEEACCGDTARRLGNEYLYQILALQNMNTMFGYGVKKIVTACPHGFNTIKNEYPLFAAEAKKENPDFTWDVQVVHASQLIGDLLATGKLKTSKKVELELAFHDSCYLGRHNDLYQVPRQAMAAVGVKLKEMPRHGEQSFCCGAGGGRMWLEEHGEKINVNRTKEAIATGAKGVAVNCPFCLTMFEDGIKDQGQEEKMKVYDLTELVAQAL